MVGHSSVLYVTDTRHGHHAWNDPSARHRCYHFADALADQSWAVSVAHIETLNARMLQSFRHIIFHRPKYSKRFAKALAACRRCDSQLHADYDDLIFAPELAENSPLYINGNRPLDKVKNYFADNQRAMQSFDSVLVSTRALCSHVRQCLPLANVSVLPNSLPRLFQTPRLQVSRDQRSKQQPRFRIGYFPGSNSHAHDIEMIRDALNSLLSKKPECRLVVVGKMAEDSLPGMVGQIEFKPFVDYNQYLRQLAQVDLSIAPLQQNVFNDCKSAVKLIESVAVGTPVLASENPDMADHQNSMSALADERSDWLDLLLHCVDRKSGFDCTASQSLREKYSVASRLPILQRHLAAAL